MDARFIMAAGALMLVALACRDDVDAPTEPRQDATATAASAAPLDFRQVSAGFYHACGVTTDDRAYCWGGNVVGQLGNGTTDYSSRAPTPVEGGLLFRTVSAGPFHNCGVTTSNRVYCWGNNEVGQLGDGTTATRLVPTTIDGGRRYRAVSAGGLHTCAVTTDDRVYCWGGGSSGQLGDGARTDRFIPTEIAGETPFRQVSAGEQHTCALTPTREAWCWGHNRGGQLGDSTNVSRTRPVQVVGGRRFRELDAGAYHTCAVTPGDRAFCWGNGRRGQLGTGKAYLSFWPRRVAGQLSIRHVAAGYWHTCAVTTANQAYCWGDDDAGALGDGGGEPVNQLAPVPVVGGVELNRIAAGFALGCGVTPDDRAYCWGANDYGQTGDGTSEYSVPNPRPVVGPT